MLAGFLSLKSNAFANGFPPARDVPKVERNKILSAYSSANSSLSRRKRKEKKERIERERKREERGRVSVKESRKMIEKRQKETPKTFKKKLTASNLDLKLNFSPSSENPNLHTYPSPSSMCA